MILTDTTKSRLFIQGDMLTDDDMGLQFSFDTETGEDIDPYQMELDETAKWIKDEEDFKQIKTSLANAGTMRYINDTIEHMIKNCSNTVLERVYEAHLLIDAMQRIAGKRADLVA